MKNTATLSIFTLLLLTVTISASTISEQNDLAKTEWLVGTWENKTPRGSIFESWRKLNDHDMAGKSFIIRGKDTITFESIRLIQKPEGWYYIPTVKNQNGGLPVSFKSTSISDTEMIFENLAHDFPQKISYRKVSPDSLIAEISGNDKGKSRSTKFPMKRIK